MEEEGKEEGDYPWDECNEKSIEIDFTQFEELDAYAQKVNVKDSVENLVSVLLQKAHSDLEKVRAIWMWICHHIEYDMEAFYDEAKRASEAADVLQSGKGICTGYCGLFEEMCSIAGIQCKTLSGYCIGYGYKAEQVIEEYKSHVWSTVHLDGRWHLLDSTWGSGCVDDKGNFTFRYSEFYFLTHPALFIEDHFPDDPRWQLLKQTLRLEMDGCDG
ncbi:kyphoscoliosis peptidase-like [Podarcis muralis]